MLHSTHIESSPDKPVYSASVVPKLLAASLDTVFGSPHVDRSMHSDSMGSPNVPNSTSFFAVSGTGGSRKGAIFGNLEYTSMDKLNSNQLVLQPAWAAGLVAGLGNILAGTVGN